MQPNFQKAYRSKIRTQIYNICEKIPGGSWVRTIEYIYLSLVK